jgi:hypothetical protein
MSTKTGTEKRPAALYTHAATEPRPAAWTSVTQKAATRRMTSTSASYRLRESDCMENHLLFVVVWGWLCGGGIGFSGYQTGFGQIVFYTVFYIIAYYSITEGEKDRYGKNRPALVCAHE